MSKGEHYPQNTKSEWREAFEDFAGLAIAIVCVAVGSVGTFEYLTHLPKPIDETVNQFATNGRCIPHRIYNVTGGKVYLVAGPNGEITVAVIGDDGNGFNALLASLPKDFVNGGYYTIQGVCSLDESIPLHFGTLTPAGVDANVGYSPRVQDAISRVTGRMQN